LKNRNKNITEQLYDNKSRSVPVEIDMDTREIRKDERK